MKASRAMRRVLRFLADTGGWLASDPFIVSTHTLRALETRGWAVVRYGLAGQALGAEPTKLGLAAARWGGWARVLATAA